MRILFRCDASSEIGMGHWMRCRALAQAAEARGASCAFVARRTKAARGQAGASKRTVWLEEDAPAAVIQEALGRAVRDSLLQADPDPVWVVIDTYEDGEAQARLARDAGAFVLAIDDLGKSGYGAHVGLNANPGAISADYAAEETRWLLGPRYALLRPEFAQAALRPPSAQVQRILVTLGGSDRNNRTSWVLKELSELPEAERARIGVDVVVGHAYRHHAPLQEQVRRLPYRVCLYPDVENMPERIAAADLAISGAGTTVYELARLGVPAVMVTLADNQRSNAEAFSRCGVGLTAGKAEDMGPGGLAALISSLINDVGRRMLMSRAGTALIDGRGAERVWQAMRECADVSPKGCR
jgi:UDP-2,4-diacetamido-2,4,6-trideoxy-beta-L-altropyranose hydrolase